MKLKRKLATQLRRIADRLDPAWLRSYDITYRAGDPVHVDLRFGGRSWKTRKRICGYVTPDKVDDARTAL